MTALKIIGLSFLIILFTSSCAVAQSPAETLAQSQPFWQTLMLQILQGALVILMPVVLLLLKRLIQVFELKTGLQLSERQEWLLESALEKGIAFAEEQARKRMNSTLPPLASDDKKREALTFVTSFLEEMEASELAKETLEKLIEAKLNTQRERVALGTTIRPVHTTL